ncbi:DUF58 domain-containing protein [Cohnella nanjingensis]|uniref:DUF58 domain-containing protein n=1 Tax=Cohnella nanjingensis TaxID=1387779 RepID=A0A7X0VES6_9BACL|nr:DUF58 domain-containing protein [Cohnella nanjingensis]MBB6670553.1 DUF58 domain-containing protein [Cohnella nanjingensis]
MIIVWLLTIFAVLFLLQRLLFSRRVLRRVAYERSFSEPHAFAGETVFMLERIVNRQWLPLPWLRVETMMPSPLQFKNQNAELAISSGQLLQNHASLFSLAPFTKVVRKHEVVCVRRGVYRIPSLSLTLGDLSGASSVSDTRESNCAITVFPRLKDVQQLPLSARKWMQSAIGMHEAFREDHYQVAGVRPYRSGDSLKQVNWNATAKTGQTLVNRRESMVDNDVTILLNAELYDASENRRIQPAVFEEAISYTASVARHLLSNGGKVGLVYNGKVDGETAVPLVMEPRAGRAHLYRMLELMARFEAVTRRELGYVLEEMAASGMRGVNLLVISAFLTPKQEQLLERLRHGGNRVEKLLLYREKEASA